GVGGVGREVGEPPCRAECVARRSTELDVAGVEACERGAQAAPLRPGPEFHQPGERRGRRRAPKTVRDLRTGGNGGERPDRPARTQPPPHPPTGPPCAPPLHDPPGGRRRTAVRRPASPPPPPEP